MSGAPDEQRLGNHYTRRHHLQHLAAGASAALAVGPLAAACGGSGGRAEERAPGPSSQPVKLVLLHAWDEARLPLMRQMADQFQQRHPQITVDFDLTTTASGMASARIQKLVTEVAAGAPPDVSMIWRGELPALALQGTLQPLEPFVARDKFDPKIYYDAEWQTSRYQNKTYVLPNVSAGGWYLQYYNKAHLTEAGYGADQAPRTWNDATTYLKKLTRMEGGQIARLGGDVIGGASGFILWTLNNNGKYLSSDGKKVLFDGPETVEALQWYQGFWDAIGGAEVVNAFLAQYRGAGAEQAPFTVGTQSIKIQNPSQIFHIKVGNPRIDFGIALPPYGPRDKQGKSFIRGGWGYGIPSGVKHPYESWLLTYWLSATKEAAGWFMVQQLRPSPMKEVNQDKTFLDQLPTAWPQLLKAMEQDIAVPITPSDGEIDKILNQAMNDVAAQKGALRDIVRQAAQDCQREIDAFWARQGK
jgi:multiple sugar transport system substrate-binding protein